ncbi:hypothetical protein [Desulfobaculum senezii]
MAEISASYRIPLLSPCGILSISLADNRKGKHEQNAEVPRKSGGLQRKKREENLPAKHIVMEL